MTTESATCAAVPDAAVLDTLLLEADEWMAESDSLATGGAISGMTIVARREAGDGRMEESAFGGCKVFDARGADKFSALAACRLRFFAQDKAFRLVGLVNEHDRNAIAHRKT